MLSLVPILKNRYLPFLLAVPLFFCVCRYNGIVADAILYVTQYAYSIDPTRFLGDPAFDFGNQSSLGFFSPILGLFLEPLGVATGSFVFTLLMQLAWIVAYIFLVKNLLRLGWQRLWLIPVIISLVCIFTNGMPFSHIIWFHYLSTYVCSRPLSIALGMGGVALLFKQKKTLSLLLILIGTVVHPLTAGWCLPFWMFYFYPKTKFPVVIASVVFPLSCLLHLGPLDVYPKDWFTNTVNGTEYEILSLGVFLFCFFGFLVRYSANRRIRDISLSMCLLVSIAFYWNIWSGFGSHIFLYQVQPWRALWLPSLLAAPLGVCLAKDVFRKYVKKGIVTSRGLGVVLLFVSFFVPVHLFSVSLAAVVLIVVNERSVSLKWFIWTYGGILLGGYLVQQYIPIYLQSSISLFNFSMIELYHTRDSFLLYQLFFSVGFAIFFFKKRRFVLAALMVLSIFLARFALMPALPLFMYLFPQRKKAKYWTGVCLVTALVVFDGVIGTETRCQTLFQGLPFSIFKTCIIVALAIASIYASKWISYKGIAGFLMACVGLAIFNYVGYYTDYVKKEQRLDPYLHETIFPQMGNRGHALFYVSGEYFGNPRLQFMTGSYYDAIARVGSAFFKGQYREALERSHLLYWKKRAPELNEFVEYSTIVSKLADTDTLIDRIEFLCQEKEIHHLVTDKSPLPFAKEDSTVINGEQKVYLYSCPSVEW